VLRFSLVDLRAAKERLGPYVLDLKMATGNTLEIAENVRERLGDERGYSRFVRSEQTEVSRPIGSLVEIEAYKTGCLGRALLAHGLSMLNGRKKQLMIDGVPFGA
jgi:hypothetical protein